MSVLCSGADWLVFQGGSSLFVCPEVLFVCLCSVGIPFCSFGVR